MLSVAKSLNSIVPRTMGQTPGIKQGTEDERQTDGVQKAAPDHQACNQAVQARHGSTAKEQASAQGQHDDKVSKAGSDGARPATSQQPQPAATTQLDNLTGPQSVTSCTTQHLSSYVTPTAAEWRDIKTTVFRIFVALSWVVEAVGLQTVTANSKRLLYGELAQLVHSLMSPHWADAQLDMAEVFQQGLRTLLFTHRLMKDRSDALAPMLQRLARDARLLPDERSEPLPIPVPVTHVVHLYSFFGGFATLTSWHCADTWYRLVNVMLGATWGNSMLPQF